MHAGKGAYRRLSSAPLRRTTREGAELASSRKLSSGCRPEGNDYTVYYRSYLVVGTCDCAKEPALGIGMMDSILSPVGSPVHQPLPDYHFNLGVRLFHR